MPETLQLSERQQAVLRRVVEEFVGTGQPVGSKTLVERSGLRRLAVDGSQPSWQSSSALGLLTHPHTSAGRVPTERGYRYYADELLGPVEPQPPDVPARPRATRQRGRDPRSRRRPRCCRRSRGCSRSSRRRRLEATTVRHVEVLLLQPAARDGRRHHRRRAASRSGSSTSPEPVDAGLAQWADDYLNERPSPGCSWSTRPAAAAASRIPASRPAERAFLRCAPAGVHRARLRRAATVCQRRCRRPARRGAGARKSGVPKPVRARRDAGPTLLDVLGQPSTSQRPFVRARPRA